MNRRAQTENLRAFHTSSFADVIVNVASATATTSHDCNLRESSIRIRFQARKHAHVRLP